MSARLRIELFPSSLSKSIDFYSKILTFTLLRHEPDAAPAVDTGYAHLTRSTIQLGLSTKPDSAYPSAVTNPQSRAIFRRWPTGVELVLEVDDVDEEMRRVVEAEWPLESQMVMQEWGLRDFRIVDPDGYFWRISETGGADGKGLDGERAEPSTA